MAFSWAIDPFSFDLIINRRGKLQITYGVQEVRQRIIVTLNHFFGEYFLAVDHGLPWYEAMLGSHDFNMVEMLIRREVLSVPGVTSLLGVSVDKPNWANNRKLSINLRVEAEGQQAPEIVDIVYSLTQYQRKTLSFVELAFVLQDESGGALLDSSGETITEG